jgi:FkbM family methyltransferase
MKRSIRFEIARRICRRSPPILARRLRTWLYPQKQAYHEDIEFVVAAQTGSKLKIRTSDYHGYRFGVHGYYDWKNCALALALATHGDTIVEVGANIGTETISFADIVGSTGKVFAFEPLPINITAVEAAIELNRFQQIVLSPMAVSDICQDLTFSLPSADNTGVGYIVSESNATGQREFITVRGTTLDEQSEQIGVAKIVFIDTEGSEVMILRGAKDYINRYRPALVLEASPELLKRAGYDSKMLYFELETMHYAVYRVSALSVKKILPGQQLSSRKDNWLCLPVERETAVFSVRRYLRLCGFLPCFSGMNPLTKKV